MSERMTPERHKELRRVAYFLHTGSMNTRAGGNSLNEALSEITDAWAANERLAAALRTIGHDLPVGFAQDRLFAAIDIAPAALSPEPDQ